MVDFTQFLQLVDLGVAVTMLFVFIKLFTRKDKRFEEHVSKQLEVQDRTIKEVTKALVDKNHTDDQMADALDRLAQVIREEKEE